MRIWKAIHREQSANDRGTLEDAHNLSLQHIGELRRRNAYSLSVASSGLTLDAFMDNLGTQRVVFMTSSGTIVEEAI